MYKTPNQKQIKLKTSLTSKFDWTLDDIKTEKISRFPEQHGPDFDFSSSSFNYFMSKKGRSGVIDETNYMS